VLLLVLLPSDRRKQHTHRQRARSMRGIVNSPPFQRTQFIFFQYSFTSLKNRSVIHRS
jgi:hypothetical protein